ncbi:MAG TPA: ShlB/FhaC/HecB family hemolysin secretion/activation protein [Falsiroseomonas sp.]|jgi:hemolysin activation/secretion protein|nr:ShlB/FhaC/HecB family hemolysin secretion/activation protein [Falsiroseomonas sp.]
MSRLRHAFASALAVALPAAAFAQSPPPLPGVIERIAPAEPPRLGPPLLPPEPERTTGPGAQRQVTIGRVVILGNTALPAAALREAVAGMEARGVTLAEIETARLAVLRAYRAAGFPYVAVGAALAPLAEGGAELRLPVTEGFVAEVVIEGEAGPAARQARRFLDRLVGQRPLPNAALERALLLASDIPGVTARGLLRPMPGAAGALQLVVRLDRRAVSGFANLDNRGYRLTGAWQGLLVGQVNALTGAGERTEIALLQTDGNGQSFVQATEELFLGGSGLRLRALAGFGRAEPGSPLAAIGYAGETRVAGVGLSYPLVRSRPLNLTLHGQFDAFESTVEARDGPGLPRVRQSRDAVRALRLGLEGAFQDAWLGRAPAAAATTGTLRLSQGIEALGASDGGSGRAARADSEFGFTRIVAEATRLQPLFVPAEGWLVSVQATLAGQWSDDVLPPAEKFYLGGNRLGRGFYAGQVSGDRALGGSVELQAGTVFPLPGLRLGTQFYLFRDEGRGFDNEPGGAERSLASWGGGVRLQFDERVQLDLEAVRRLTRSPEGAGVARLDEDALFARVLVRF